MKIATVSMNCVYDKKVNLKKYMEMIDEAKAQGADLIVFPEQSLQAYLQSLAVRHDEDFGYQFQNAEMVPEGESTQALIQKAKETGMYIIYGMTEQDSTNYYYLYNTMVLVGPEGYVGKYRKVHLPGDELHFYNKGNDFPVYDTKIGKIGMLICYDKSFPEPARELALGGAELLVMSTAWGMGDVENKAHLEQDRNYFIYNITDTMRALENQCFFISSNQVGKTGDIEYFGNSNIMSPDGIKLATTGYAEGIAYAEVNVKEDIYKARSEGYNGFYLLRDRSPQAYKRMCSQTPWE